MNPPIDRPGRLPLTYDECRARFRHVVGALGLPVETHPLDVAGPEGQRLSVDVTAVGSASPERALLVLSGVHGVEGFIGSALQCAFLDRLAALTLPDDVGVVVVHAVNPWGMAWGRRQDDANVDLNRNWRRSDRTVIDNDDYDEVHPLACPATAEIPDVGELLVAAADLVERWGLDRVRDAITVGQYRHADGLHFGGHETRPSNRVLERIVDQHLGSAQRVLVVDLHTGHGPRGEAVALVDDTPDGEHARFLRAALPTATVEATRSNPDATTGTKSGQIGNGVVDLLPGAVGHATSLEIGTTPDEEQLVATFLEHWVHHHGDRTRPDHAAVAWAYRCCFTPDDAVWEARARQVGGRQLDDALAAVVAWT